MEGQALLYALLTTDRCSQATENSLRYFIVRHAAFIVQIDLRAREESDEDNHALFFQSCSHYEHVRVRGYPQVSAERFMASYQAASELHPCPRFLPT
jgi:hypothetical protein